VSDQERTPPGTVRRVRIGGRCESRRGCAGEGRRYLLAYEPVDLLVVPLLLRGELVGDGARLRGRRRIAKGIRLLALLLLLLLLLVECQAKASGHERRRGGRRRRRDHVLGLEEGHAGERRRLLRLDCEQTDALIPGPLPPTLPTRCKKWNRRNRHDPKNRSRPRDGVLLFVNIRQTHTPPLPEK
jgi:hypothetical protein